MANNQLILGAGKAAKKFVDVGAEMSKGFSNSGLTARGFKKPNTVTENEKYRAQTARGHLPERTSYAYRWAKF